MKIYLVGMPGSGKSTLGVRLAQHLNTDFIDLDKEIEKRELKSIPDIFSQNGEDYFRQKEAEILREFSASSSSFVLATGGGAPCFYNGMASMNETGISIFLDVDIPELIRRVQNNPNRPLLQTADLTAKLNDLRAKRYDIYTKAKIHVKDPSLSKVIEKLKM